MIVNGQSLMALTPIRDMIGTKEKAHGLSYGLSEVGYDFRLKQKVVFTPPHPEYFAHAVRDNEWWNLDRYMNGYVEVYNEDGTCSSYVGRTAIGSSIEFFDIPCNLWCEFRNKSTHARRFLDASLGTDGEPGWTGHLTIEMVFQGNEPYTLESGTPILKAVFHEITEPQRYVGKYNNQPDRPVPAIFE